MVENFVDSEKEGEMVATMMLDLTGGEKVFTRYIKRLPQLFDLLSDQTFCERAGYCLEVGDAAINYYSYQILYSHNT